MKNLLKSYISDQSGAMSVEYALVAVLVSLGGLKCFHCITEYGIAPMFEDAANAIDQTGEKPADS